MKYKEKTLIIYIILIISLFPGIRAIYSYCKCTCFGNSTILRLNESTIKNKPCQDCTKEFCLEQSLPICQNIQFKNPEDLIENTDISTICFRTNKGKIMNNINGFIERESIKDMTFIYIFIIITGILLILAPLRPYTTRFLKKIRR
ncbi:hypothetical protein T552_04084 [Pneumocystis carinii B80]|uniref:Uncharacterized protein n=1 Tax=Pneumocystis carinii (strain B80) TaxID=1408658 RepID=A0A0W4ZPJ3_PNEC8|nr:hypothetical protein T552_04084 [Pneumocystis carinii B80]KTW30284.1 hypothetical protein T552_04084 [Pneumocystis carinii B80]